MKKNIFMLLMSLVMFFSGCSSEKKQKEEINAIDIVSLSNKLNEKNKNFENFLKTKGVLTISPYKTALLELKELEKGKNLSDSLSGEAFETNRDNVLAYEKNIKRVIETDYISLYLKKEKKINEFKEELKKEIPNLLNELSSIKNKNKDVQEDKIRLESILSSINKVTDLDSDFERLTNDSRSIYEIKMNISSKYKYLDQSVNKTIIDMKVESHSVRIYFNSNDGTKILLSKIKLESDLKEFSSVKIDENNNLIFEYKDSNLRTFVIRRNIINLINSNLSSIEEGGTISIEKDNKFYFKYLIVENNSTRESWEEVDEETFYKNINNLGMSIYSKPYGVYPQQANNNPTPPGLDFVGNPQYGEYKTNSFGESFFYYYGIYSIFNDLSGNKYSQSYERDYRDYKVNNRNNGYYNGGFGTKNVASSDFFKKRNFDFKNIKKIEDMKQSIVKNKSIDSFKRTETNRNSFSKPKNKENSSNSSKYTTSSTYSKKETGSSFNRTSTNRNSFSRPSSSRSSSSSYSSRK